MIEAVMMTPAERVLLERNELFRNIPFESIEPILKGCQVVTLKRGATLLEVGQKNTSLYLVLEGELHIYLNGSGLPAHAALGVGECVGELSLIDGGNSAALVMAARDTRLLEVPHERVWTMVDNSNDIARNLLAILAGRIRNDNLLQVTTSEASLEFELATHIDALTGLHNKNWMRDALPRMAQRCERNKMPLFLLLADIDHFKEFNESHGHLAGDGVLRGAARILAANLRPHDLLAYLGCDRFVILLPEKSADGAMKIAERLSEAVEVPTLRFGDNNAPLPASDTQAIDNQAIQIEHIALSLGVVEITPADTLDSALAVAEDALQQAKADGQKRVNMAATRC